MKKNLLLLAFLSFALSAFAGTDGSTLKGIVLDEQNKPVPYATVMLKNAADSSLYKGEIANEKGEFKIEDIKAGNFFLQIQMSGYETKIVSGIKVSDDAPTIDLGKITMLPSSKELAAVEIKAEKPFIERQVDRTVVNIENSIVQAGSTILEVMSKLPGVLVDADGNISLKGKQSVIIMIDNKPNVLSGQDLSNMLRSMQASNTQKIEIITNPSAKYDAAGGAGIINIVLKRNRLDGFTGNVNAGYGQGRYASFNTGLNLNYKKKWYNLFLTYSYLNKSGFTNLILLRKFYNEENLYLVFDTDNYIPINYETHTPRIGADFYLSKKTTLSILGNSVFNVFKPSATNHTNILDGDYKLVNSYDFINKSRDDGKNFSFNSELSHHIDSIGQDIVLNLDYGNYGNIADQLFTTTTMDPSGNIIDKSYLVGKKDGKLSLYSIKLDYTKPLKSNAKFEAGAKSSYVDSDKDMAFYNRIDHIDHFDTARSSHFLYSENINAAYVNYSKELKKFSYQIGLRAEQTLAKGKQLLNNASFDRNYLQVFPTVFLDYKINENHGINLSLGRRIDRPGYEQLNPFKRLIDATTYSEGNPFLLPQLSYNTELTYSYKNALFITASYSLTKDNVTSVLIQNANSQTTVQAYVNIDQVNNANLSFTYSKRLTSWWTTNSTISGYYSHFEGIINNYELKNGAPSFYLTTNNSFSIMDGLSMECSFEYSHKNVYGVTEIKSNNNLTIGVQKSIFNKRGTITLNVQDILWAAYPSGETQFDQVNEVWDSIRDTRVANLNFTYKFGKGQGSKMRKKTGADEEKNRI